MSDLLTKQQRVKYYDELKANKYRISCRPEVYNEEANKELDRLRSLGTIVTKLSEEYPNLQPIIRKVESSIQTKLNNEEENDGFDNK